jgi:hypothetical protein
MLKILLSNIRKKFEIFGLVLLVLFTAISTIYLNSTKKENLIIYDNFIDNIYFKKTLTHIVENLEPKYKKIKHKIKSGETFDKILENYQIQKKEILEIKNSLKKKVNLNKLNTQQIIMFSLDKTNNQINEFTFQISNKQKIFLVRDNSNNTFSDEIISIKLNKKIVYKENLILQSLYKAATDEKIPANIIIEFAGIYGFQVDFSKGNKKTR